VDYQALRGRSTLEIAAQLTRRTEAPACSPA
jgi:hypothetical protein